MGLPEQDMAKIRRALRYAEEKHRGETRKGTEDSPYILHPTAVALLVAMSGAPVHVIVAAVLHDTVEDTDATPEEIGELFGSKAAGIVDALTKPKGRKLSAIETSERLLTLDDVAAKAADLAINLGDVVDDADACGVDHLRLLFKDPVEKLDSYLELLELLTHRLIWQPQGVRRPPAYVDEIARRLGDLEARARDVRNRLAARNP